MKTIEITVTPSGDIAIDAMGFKGADCEQATRFLEQALGVNARKEKKPEYFQQLESRQRQGIGS